MTFLVTLGCIAFVVLLVALVVEEADRRLSQPVPYDDTPSRGSFKTW